MSSNAENDWSNMYCEKNRLATFWWTMSFGKRHELAKNGFFAYDDIGNIRCHFCDLILDWFITNPVSQHVVRAPHCSFINGLTTNNRPIQTPLFRDMLTTDEMHESYNYQDPTDRFPIIHSSSFLTVPISIGLPHYHHPPPVHQRKLPHPKFPCFSSIWTRKSSYTDWPDALNQTPELLSDAGFFYSQFNDKVTCFQCGGSIHKWKPQAKPWEQHASWFPHCHYVLVRKGRNFIDKILSLPTRPENPTPAPEPVPEPAKPNNISDKFLCKICYQHEINIALIPCGHCVACNICVWSITTCPICRTNRTTVLKIYLQ